MSTQPTNLGNAINPLAYMGEMNIFYAFTADSIQQIESGVFRTTSGENLQMRRITSEMMKGNQGLIAEIHALALLGHLGFASQGSNNIRFRSDVAEKIGQTRSFQVFNIGHPEQTEQFNAGIEGVDKTEYTNLTEQFITLEKDEKDAGEEKKAKHESIEKTQHRGSSSQRVEKILPKSNAKAVNQLTRGIQQQANTIKENHRKHTAEARREEAKREHDDVKRSTIKGEIKKAEITQAEEKRGYKRQEQNAGGVEIDISNNKAKGVAPQPSQKIRKRKLS